MIGRTSGEYDSFQILIEHQLPPAIIGNSFQIPKRLQIPARAVAGPDETDRNDGPLIPVPFKPNSTRNERAAFGRSLLVQIQNMLFSQVLICRG
jgi:hypothetical protein